MSAAKNSAEKVVEELLYDLICSGGGDAEVIAHYALRIVKAVRLADEKERPA